MANDAVPCGRWDPNSLIRLVATLCWLSVLAPGGGAGQKHTLADWGRYRHPTVKWHH
ncbi:MAG: hypothetical protein AVDCRST_MAG93-7530 [uncultured Chloroflexia bacterium]|uniref:Uncharacterized protein n=1 Tax=uncultured Chloroflexia bacterium TaxID=1672391 RepID=A0A6J4MGQ5_9CHLR|nr:MAG: hypothetical protein AVDCRST_MAG93-7530 [uncultured Chloroflexia bacterium]